MMSSTSVPDNAIRAGTPDLPSIEPLPSSGRDRLLIADKPLGILAARSRTSIKLTFQPLRAAIFEVGLIVRVAALNRDGEKVL